MRLYYVHRRELKSAFHGNIVERVALRKRLNRTSFKGNLENVLGQFASIWRVLMSLGFF